MPSIIDVYLSQVQCIFVVDMLTKIYLSENIIFREKTSEEFYIGTDLLIIRYQLTHGYFAPPTTTVKNLHHSSYTYSKSCRET